MEAVDIDVPPLPRKAWLYLQMRVDDLTPNELWATAEEDYLSARDVQAAWNKAIREVRDSVAETQGT